MSLLLPNASGHSYSLCLSTVLQFGCLQPLFTCRCLIVLLAKLADLAVEESAAIFGTSAKWHLYVCSSRLTVWLITLCVVFFQNSMCCGDQPAELLLLTVDLLRCLGLELCSFRAILFYLVFDCGMSCMNLSLLVKAWVLLKLQSIAFFYKVDCPLFLPSLRLFLFHFSFSRDLR